MISWRAWSSAFGPSAPCVDSYVLHEPLLRFLAGTPAANQPSGTMAQVMPALNCAAQVLPTRMVGWALISIGSVLVLHALALKNPGRVARRRAV